MRLVTVDTVPVHQIDVAASPGKLSAEPLYAGPLRQMGPLLQ